MSSGGGAPAGLHRNADGRYLVIVFNPLSRSRGGVEALQQDLGDRFGPEAQGSCLVGAISLARLVTMVPIRTGCHWVCDGSALATAALEQFEQHWAAVGERRLRLDITRNAEGDDGIRSLINVAAQEYLTRRWLGLVFTSTPLAEVLAMPGVELMTEPLAEELLFIGMALVHVGVEEFNAGT